VKHGSLHPWRHIPFHPWFHVTSHPWIHVAPHPRLHVSSSPEAQVIARVGRRCSCQPAPVALVGSAGRDEPLWFIGKQLGGIHGSDNGERMQEGAISSASSSSSRPLHPLKETLGSSSASSYSPDIRVVEVACGFPWVLSECWGGTTCGDRQSFAQVLRQRQAPVIMVPPRRPCRWGREGFGGGRFGSGGARFGHQGNAWYRRVAYQQQGREDGVA
jgi:hypothetical protein